MKHNHKKLIPFLLLILFAAFALCGCDNIISPTVDINATQLQMHVIDVGQGDSILIKLPNAQNMLVDCGNNYNAADIKNYLSAAGVSRIDYLVATHPHADHIGAMADIIGKLDIGQIYMPKVSNNTATYQKLLETIDAKGLKIKTAESGVIIYADNETSVDILAPISGSYSDLNDYSAVLRIKYKSVSFLLMGDAGKTVEKELMNKYTPAELRADVLKVAHHGSRTASGEDFIADVSPKYAVISVGKDNTYGLPDEDAVAVLNKYCPNVLRTDVVGSVVIASDGENVEYVSKE